MKMPLLSLALLLLAWCFTKPVVAQQTFEKELPHFTRVYVSDHIDLLLEKGKSPSTVVSYENAEAEDIHLEVNGSTLRIFMEGCRRGCRDNQYHNAHVQVHLNYQILEKLVVMGEQTVEHLGEIRQDSFVLKAFGENEIRLDSIYTQYLKLSLFGDSQLYTRVGIVNDMILKTFGDQQVNLANLAIQNSKVKVFGESELDLQVHETLRLSVMGNADIQFNGNPWVYRRLVLGEVSISHHNQRQESSAWGAFFRW